jgi:hypothetical protein
VHRSLFNADKVFVVKGFSAEVVYQASEFTNLNSPQA